MVGTDLRVENVAEQTEDRLPTPPVTRLAFRLFLGSVVAAVVPVAVATGRAIRDGWIPIGDNALFVIRGRDLFTHHLPLIGTYSSASLTVGADLNHPGPLYFDVLAVPARLVESGAGIAFGVAVVNSLCIVGIAVFAYRRGGALLGTAAMAATAALCWAMGSELLFEPWNPHSVLLPFLFFLILVWSLTCGDLLALPFAAAAGSVVVQTHLSYVLLVPLLGAWGVMGLALWLRRDRRHTGTWPARRRRALRFAAVGGVVLVVCWIQPMIEQFTSDGPGNLTLLVENSRGSDAQTIGYGLGARIVAAVVSLPPWWFRPSLEENFISGWRAPSLGAALLSLGVLIAVLAWCGFDARRRRDRVALWAIASSFVALLTALVTAGQGPITVFGNVTPHTFRWLWPMGAFVFFAVVAAFVRRFTHSGAASPRLVGVFALVTLAVAALNVPRADEGLGPNSQQYAIPATRDLERQIGALEGQGPLLIDDLFHGAFADPYGWAVVAELQRQGIPFVARDPGTVRQLGPARRFNGHNAKAALLLRQGEATLEAPAGSRRVARGEGLPAAEVRELARLEKQIGDYIGQRGLRLNARGQAALEAGTLPTVARSTDAPLDVSALFATRELDVMIRDRYLVLDDVWSERFARYADLQHEWDQKTVALFVGPLSSARSRA